MNKIVSFCLYGNSPIYKVGIRENLELCKQFYRDWSVIVFCDKENFEELSEVIYSNNGTPILIEDMHLAFSRLIPLNTNKEGVTIFRDADSRISKKEFSAVEEWLTSDKTLHIMKDHYAHTNDILCGMFGVKSHKLPDIDLNITHYNYGDDEALLSREVWSRLKDDHIMHGELFGGLPFPEDDLSETGGFVGQKILI